MFLLSLLLLGGHTFDRRPPSALKNDCVGNKAELPDLFSTSWQLRSLFYTFFFSVRTWVDKSSPLTITTKSFSEYPTPLVNERVLFLFFSFFVRMGVWCGGAQFAAGETWRHKTIPFPSPFSLFISWKRHNEHSSPKTLEARTGPRHADFLKYLEGTGFPYF